MDAILSGCPGKPEVQDYDKIVDDIIQWSDSMEQAFNRICSILSHCSKAGMVFNPDKFQFAKDELQYAGYMVGGTKIRPTDTETQTQTHRHRHTDTDTQTQTHRHRHTDRDTQTHTETHRDTQRHTETHRAH